MARPITPVLKPDFVQFEYALNKGSTTLSVGQELEISQTFRVTLWDTDSWDNMWSAPFDIPGRILTINGVSLTLDCFQHTILLDPTSPCLGTVGQTYSHTLDFGPHGRVQVTLPALASALVPMSGKRYVSWTGRAPIRLKVTADGANTSPQAVDDSAIVRTGLETSIDVIANDSDPDSDRLYIKSFTNGAHGQVRRSTDGRLVYTPTTGFVGIDRFSYTASDFWGSSDNATVSVTVHKIIYVSALRGSDANGGLTWATAKQTIQPAINTAVAIDQVWVEGGNIPYCENLVLANGVSLYGGFVGTEELLSDRPAFPRVDLDTFESAIDGSGDGCVVTIPQESSKFTRLDGFTIRGGAASLPGSGGGVTVISGSPVVSNNKIVSNSAVAGGGVFCAGGSPTIERNQIAGNSALRSGGGIWCDAGFVLISHNRVEQNRTGDIGTLSGTGGGIGVSGGAARIVNNVISANSSGIGGGVLCVGGEPELVCNTIVANADDGLGGGITFCDGALPTVANNIVAWNSSGIAGLGDWNAFCNNVYNPNGPNYSYLSPGNGDISLDPLFVDVRSANYHLRRFSPCINVGSSSAPNLPAMDLDGMMRATEGKPVIGAYEYSSANDPNLIPVVGDDYAQTVRGMPVHINVLTNDLDPEGYSLYVAWVGQPAHGYTYLESDGSVLYTPILNFFGEDTFDYVVSDMWGGIAMATVRISVIPEQIGSLHIRVTLNDWTCPFQVTVPVTIMCRNIRGQTARNDLTMSVVSVAGHGTADISLDGLELSTYDILVKPSHWLAAKSMSIRLNGQEAWGSVVCKNGDINGDNAVNFSDLLILLSHYKKPPGYTFADTNGDGAVDFSDYLILQRNYKQLGESF